MWIVSCFGIVLFFPSSEKFELLEIILTSLHSNSYTNVVLYEIHVNDLHVYHSYVIRKEKIMNLNSKIEEKRGGAITDICLFIFLLVQEKLKNLFQISYQPHFYCYKFCSHASRKSENTIVNCIIIMLYSCG